jgi:hypothetical protein
MHFARASMFAVALLAAAMVGCESNKKTEPAPMAEKPLSRTDTARVVLTSRVKSIDYTTRYVTLTDSAGHDVSFIAGPQVQRLNEVRVGDSVKVEYNATLLAELRPPTAAEAATPYSTTTSTNRSSPGSNPSAGASQVTTVVTTVTAIDLANMYVTLKGPLGDTTTVRARSPENIRKLHVGDTIVLTYSEAVAVSLIKA